MSNPINECVQLNNVDRVYVLAFHLCAEIQGNVSAKHEQKRTKDCKSKQKIVVIKIINNNKKSKRKKMQVSVLPSK